MRMMDKGSRFEDVGKLYFQMLSDFPKQYMNLGIFLARYMVQRIRTQEDGIHRMNLVQSYSHIASSTLQQSLWQEETQWLNMKPLGCQGNKLLETNSWSSTEENSSDNRHTLSLSKSYQLSIHLVKQKGKQWVCPTTTIQLLKSLSAKCRGMLSLDWGFW